MRLRYLLAPLVLALTPLSLVANAHDHDHGHEHQHSLAAHVHGVATLNIALEGQQLEMHLESPMMNIVGFEYQPSSAADKQAVVEAERTLKDEQLIFALTPDAQCALSSISIDNDLAEQDQDAHQHAAPAEDHADHQHSDIQASYMFNCTAPSKLNSIDLAGLFKAFPQTEKIRVQLITPSMQQGIELSPSQTSVSW